MSNRFLIWIKARIYSENQFFDPDVIDIMHFTFFE